VNEIELTGAPKEFADMQRAEDLAVERRVFIDADRDDRCDLAGKV
jgi:hypothetical protein